MDEETIKKMFELYNNAFFKNIFLEFMAKMQQDGIDAARDFWNNYPEKGNLLNFDPDIFEQLIEFYSSLGFVPRKKHEEVIKENEQLKKEIEFLKNTIKELNVKVFTEEGRKTQEIWKSTIEKQIEVNKEIAKSFIDLFK